MKAKKTLNGIFENSSEFRELKSWFITMNVLLGEAVYFDFIILLSYPGLRSSLVIPRKELLILKFNFSL